MKHLIRLRKMINLALKLDWITKDPFANYKMKFDKVEKECLNKNELERLEKKQFAVERLDMVRDLFVFSCYTGLAYADVANLTEDHIVIGNDQESWLKLSRQKSTTAVNLPLLPQAINIVKKYKHDIRANAMERIFPIPSNQKVNSYPGEIADLCTIKKRLTFHIARHTFATTVTLANGVPIETVSRMLGHTKIATTQIYTHIHQEKISADMAELKKKLSGNTASKKKRKAVCAPTTMSITRFNS
jgi:site-specific recombinase XerD